MRGIKKKKLRVGGGGGLRFGAGFGKFFFFLLWVFAEAHQALFFGGGGHFFNYFGGAKTWGKFAVFFRFGKLFTIFFLRLGGHCLRFFCFKSGGGPPFRGFSPGHPRLMGAPGLQFATGQ